MRTKLFFSILLLIGITAVAIFAPAQTKKADGSKECVISIDAVSSKGHGAAVVKYLDTTPVKNAKECFAKALTVAEEDALTSGTTELKTGSAATRKVKTWKKFVSWEFKDNAFWPTSGMVSSATRDCLQENMPPNLDRDLRKDQDCESFNSRPSPSSKPAAAEAKSAQSGLR